MARNPMEEGGSEPQLYSSTAQLLPNEDRALAAQLARSMGLVADWQLIRYHPSIALSVVTCLLLILVQVAVGIVFYFLPRLAPADSLTLCIILVEGFVFALVCIVHVVQNRFLVSLKTRGYLLVIGSFKCLRRVPLIIACLYMPLNLTLLGVVVYECPKALKDPVNKTCENSWFLQKPYWLFYYVSLVGQGALLTCACIAILMRLVRFHRHASRGRVLPDVLSELAELNVNNSLAMSSVSQPNGIQHRNEEAVLNSNSVVAEVHSRIVDIIDQPSNTESLSRVVMERQADLLFYMHQRIECLQEELARVMQRQQTA